MKKDKKIILMDLDGVLNNYIGNYHKDYIPELRDGAKEFIKMLQAEFNIKLFTTRNAKMAQDWLDKNQLSKYFIGITDNKEKAWLYIDDRCLNFRGNYNDIYNKIKEFKPWYKE